MARHWTEKGTPKEQFRELAREAVIQMFLFQHEAARVLGNVNAAEANIAFPWNKGLQRYGRIDEANVVLSSYERYGGLPFRGKLFPWELSPENLDRFKKRQSLPGYGESVGRPPSAAGLDAIENWIVQDLIGEGLCELLNTNPSSQQHKEAHRAIQYIAEFRFNTTSTVATRLDEDPVGREITKRVEVLREALVEELSGILARQLKDRGSKQDSSGIETSKNQKLAQKPLTYPVLARLCWCMEKAGKTDHRITDLPSADRLAKRYGLSHERSGEKLKQERDRFDGLDGTKYRLGGRSAQDRYGRRVFGQVETELRQRGQTEAAALAEEILRDL